MFVIIPVLDLSEIGPPKPSELQIDYGDADSVLRAAGVLEQHGSGHEQSSCTSTRRRCCAGSKTGLYAENCIKEVERKIARANG
jgi:hypothetical protein